MRRQAAQWLEEGVPAEVARRLRVSATAMYGRRQRWRQGGVQALASKSAPGSRCRLDEDRLRELATVLNEGPAAHGFTEDQRWTLARVADLIARGFRIRYTLRCHDHHVPGGLVGAGVHAPGRRTRAA
ncbi:hypothetical protein QLQ12_39370 [Actinoplanes sp. NEAU-A12]|uniref:Transposase n=1 Tax=Actinoplanes sandaracinus TaxID=3045177 RepID=A0ABT6WY42_9ACTN|nr:helix-turn-helix domain-containing protein [Actinoplanes sandaracinus]MDI6104670.1 hypothetical protein [Actinoplanes sandaracinus]